MTQLALARLEQRWAQARTLQPVRALVRQLACYSE
jgi:hypothetical protein